jgi:DNA replication protein DnaC
MNDELKTQLQLLRLSHSAQVLDEHLDLAISQDLSFDAFLKNLLDDEIAHRKTKRIQNRIRQAQLSVIKSIENFDFSFPTKIPKQLVLSLLSCKFIEEHKNVIFLGAPGLGKTHLAAALLYQACLNDFHCRFITAGNLIYELNASVADNTILKTLKRFSHYQLLVIDELGYLPVDKHGCDLLFQVISNRYEKGSMIVTSNLPFRDWGQIFNNDSILASAIIDRLVHHAEIIKIEGDSYRVKKN